MDWKDKIQLLIEQSGAESQFNKNWLEWLLIKIDTEILIPLKAEAFTKSQLLKKILNHFKSPSSVFILTKAEEELLNEIENNL